MCSDVKCHSSIVGTAVSEIVPVPNSAAVKDTSLEEQVPFE